jgi:hypothetical protein
LPYVKVGFPFSKPVRHGGPKRLIISDWVLLPISIFETFSTGKSLPTLAQPMAETINATER